MNNLRKEIKDIVSNPNFNRVDLETNYELSGIYMLYVEDDFDKEILPIYIGRSKNIQKRYKEHLESMMAINKLNSKELSHLVFDKDRQESYYSGQFKYVKILLFMIDNQKTLDDIKMIILEECDEESINERELFFINQFKAPYVGFNQFNSRTLYFELKEDGNKFIEQEMLEIPKWLDYGYTKFNANIIYSAYFERLLFSIKENSPMTALDNNLYTFIEKYVVSAEDMRDSNKKYEIVRSLHGDIYHLENQLEINLKGLYSNFYQMIKNTLSGINKEYKARIDREKLLVGLLEGTLIETLPDDIQYKFMDDNKEIIDTYLENQKKKKQCENEFLEEREVYFKTVEYIYKYVLPKRDYDSFPLKSITEKNLDYPISSNKNLLKVSMLIGNNGLRVNSYPFIVKMGIKYYELNKEVEKIWYVEGDTTLRIKEGLDYTEKDRTRHITEIAFKTPDLMNIIPKDYENYISINVEQKYGINDHVIKEQKLTSFDKIFEELNCLFDESEGMIVRVSEGPKSYKTAINSVVNDPWCVDHETNCKVGYHPLFRCLQAKTPKNRQFTISKRDVIKFKKD
ncbi:GIY-YIG nuclease family protein [Vagococcus carniphilus]|uniref:GIY-YIG nuclease family protein n=1 Tax=Vagococcus carniphilus TaxID=218144 RepID=A0AAW8UBL4_9ENTE|nr:GIY-YIG nuclease family protein [Vagococcus carniphilus]MDT2835074.1 GIY-YIG nuclease family protein [Vagococcus carniphilus]